MTRAKLSYGLLTSQNQGGGNKKQGLAPSIGKGQYIFRIISRKSSHTEKEVEKEKEAVVLPASSFQDAFLIKYSDVGDAQWSKTIKGTGNDYGSRIEVDSLDNIYLTGRYNSTTPIDLGNGQILPVSTNTKYDVFLIKYSDVGQAQWAKTIKGTEDDYGNGIAVDSSNNIYLTGTYNSSTIIDLGNGKSLPVSINNDGFLIKYSAGGDAQWYKTIKGTGFDYGFGIEVDSGNNIYLSGLYNSSTGIDLDNGVSLPASTGYDGFLIKYSAGGDAQWSKTIKGTETDNGYGVAVDSSNNIYLTGYYNSSTGIPLGNTQILPANTNQDGFLIKYSDVGDAQWYKTIPGTGDDIGVRIAVDSLDNIYLTGLYNSSTGIPLGNGKNLPVSTNQDGFLIKYSGAGDAQWVQTIQGTGNDNGNEIAVDSLNNIYLTGYYNSSTAIVLKAKN